MDQELFFRHSTVPVVDIDGERFLLTVPNAKLWTQFLDAVSDGLIRDEYTEHLLPDTLVYDVDITSSGWTVEYLKKDGEQYYVDLGCFRYTARQGGYVDHFEDIPTKIKPQSRVGLRLMLVPMDKSGHIDSGFSKNNPDGSILEGGYLSLKRKGLPLCGQVLPGLEPPELEPGTTGCSIRMRSNPGRQQLYDSMEGPLKWWSFGGCLISTNQVLVSDYQTIWGMALLPILLPDYAKYLPKAEKKAGGSQKEPVTKGNFF